MATGIGLKPIDYPWNSAFRNTEVFEIESKAAGFPAKRPTPETATS
jgi:hypothetical protein